MKVFFKYIVVSCMLYSLPTWANSSPPNVIFILADDLGIGDVKCYGQDRCLIDTPNVDLLAAEGIRFTDAYVNASVCIPTRVAIMTGRYPWRFGKGVQGGPWGFLGPRFDDSTFTLGKLFQRGNYHTAYIGKWHLGTEMTTNDGGVQGPANVDFSKPLRTGAGDHGFLYSFILPGSLDMFPYAFVRNGMWQGQVTAEKGWSAFNRIGPAEENFEDHQVLETFYQEAEGYLSRQSNSQPFFLYLALTAPHTPTSPGLAWQGKSELGVYGDFVMEVDHAVERIMRVLRENKLDENTLVLFGSDHGPASYAGNILKATPGQIRQMEAVGHYPGGEFRGYKFSVYEGGLRVPLVARWPRGIKAGSVCSELVGYNDLMATFAEIAEIQMQEWEGPDSISFAALLKDPKKKGARRDLVMQGAGPFVIRQENWKLCLCPGSGASGKHGNQPASDVAWRKALSEVDPEDLKKENLHRGPFVQLFDLATDPGENKNLATENPEKVEQLLQQLRARVDSGRSTPGPNLENDRDRIELLPRIPEFVREMLRR